ncbi:MAG: MG2 domain-containing protein, partial [Thermoanaerobaculia bacterium]
MAAPPQVTTTYAALKQQAEEAYAEKSFGRAHELYEQASRLDAPQQEKRWIAMRLADTAWRNDAANPGADDTHRSEAQRALEDLIRTSEEDHDRVWAEANESLGDYWWTHPRLRNFSQAPPFYTAALEWWAGSPEIALARKRYLSIVFRMDDRPDQEWYPWMVSQIPQDILQNAVTIAESPADRAHTRYLLATQLVNQGPPGVERGLELLDEVIRQGKTTAWYDDALYVAASQLANRGRVVVREDGETALQPDYTKALELYRKLITEFARGESRYWDNAKQAVDQITAPVALVMVAGTFLPRSEQEIALSWRNVGSIDLQIARIDLIRDVKLDPSRKAWLETLPITNIVRRWTFQTNDKGDHMPGNDRVRLTPKLEPGAYVVQATSRGPASRQLILVTDANVLVHQAGVRADLIVNDAQTGEPAPGSRVRAWLQRYDSTSAPVAIDATTDASGLATINLPSPNSAMIHLFASTPSGRQAYWESQYYVYGPSPDEWRIYAFTDRPAYRPGETVKWKFIARDRQNNQWRTPANETLYYQITSPRGEKTASGTAKLSQFGSFWSELPLLPTMPLGQYTIEFRREERQSAIASAVLFRMEEYKLPEFRVDVRPSDDHGKKKQFRLGETIEVAIDATYYFGGPVANANVEAVVNSRPFVRYWDGWREYPWYFPTPDYGSGQQVKREILKTDANGRAILHIETAVDGGDTTFNINARVTDASRREVTGEGSVRVTRQRYSVIAHPQHYLFRPGDKVAIDFKAVDANDQPIETTGTVKVIRRRWDEVWIDATGHETSHLEGDLRSREGWRQKFAGYREEPVLTTKVTTNAAGEATVTFDAPEAGYYAVRWTSEDRDPGRPVRARDIVVAETTVWVTRTATLDLGYHAGGIEIIADEESFRSGRTAPVMIVTPASGRWVMLTTSAASILNTQVLHLDGTVKLVEIALDDRHVPSFYLTASSVFDRTLASTAKSILVPPVEHFIDVEVKPGREEYEPRQKGTVTITTRNVDGKPVQAEVSVSVSDESVTAIQSDPAGDPRQFFFGALTAVPVQAGASVQTQRYLALLEKDAALIDDRELAERERRKALLDKDGREENERDDRGFAVNAAAPPPPMEAPMSRSAVAESITVTTEMKAMDALGAKKEGGVTGQIQVRSDFRSTAFWQPDVMTGPDGTATVSFALPEALTTWRATARAVTTTTQVGMGSGTTRTNMPLIVRLQAPRFFVAGDRATVSAVINNNTDAAMGVTPSLEVEGLSLQGSAASPEVSVPPHGESRADWIVVAAKPGSATLRVSGRSADRGDAMEKKFTVYPHGIDKLLARSGKLRGEEAIIKLDLPHDRSDTAMMVQIQPSLAVTMLDALPYLIDYPYGCTEQTMSRFLPAAIVARTLAQNGIDAASIEGRMFGGIEPASATQTHPKGPRDLGQLTALTDASMARLYDFQHSDGGWGWWKDGGSDDFMTAYVVWGFAVAKEGGLSVKNDAIANALSYLDRRLVKHENDWPMQAWMLHAAAAWRAANGSHIATTNEKRALDNVWAHRERLTSYSRAL